MANERILFVDDEPNVLSSYKRNLAFTFDVETALGGEAAIEKIRSQKPFAVVVSDLRMPEMDGVEFLGHVRSLSPDTVRMMLTGYADLDAAMAAVNQGSVFRFLTKPCDEADLADAIRAGLEQYRLVTAEKTFLRDTLRGSVKVLTEILSLSNPEAFGRCERIRRNISRVGKHLNLPNLWKLELAAMMSQIGCIIVPEELLRRKYAGEALNPEEEQIVSLHPIVGSGLIAHIPSLDGVADIIARQEDSFSSDPKGSFGAQMLKLAIDFDTLEYKGVNPPEAFAELRTRGRMYNPKLLAAFERVLCQDQGYISRALPLEKLEVGMILAGGVSTTEGALLMAKGQELTTTSISRLKNFSLSGHEVSEPIHVHLPLKGA